ncbi:11846_t:CDS:2, partial [Racocetra persica]
MVHRLPRLPFPPSIQVQDIIKNFIAARKNSKAPSAFFIYRRTYTEFLRNNYYDFKSLKNKISVIASTVWKQEPQTVKYKYEQLSEEVAKELIETMLKEHEIERIDYLKFDDIKEVGRGGNAIVYSAKYSGEVIAYKMSIYTEKCKFANKLKYLIAANGHQNIIRFLGITT